MQAHVRVHPNGQPIRASTNCGLSFRPLDEVVAPGGGVSGQGREGSNPWRARVSSEGVPFDGRRCSTFPSFCEVPYWFADGVGKRSCDATRSAHFSTSAPMFRPAFADSPRSAPCARFGPSVATGVGQARTASVSIVPGCMTPVVVECRAEERESAVVAVGHMDGHDEETLTLVRSPDVRSSEQYRRSEVAHLFKVPDHVGESVSQMVGDVLEEADERLDLANDTSDVWPEMARVVDSSTLAGL